MTTPKKLTEAQAQVLANDWNVFIAVDKDGNVLWFTDEPGIGLVSWYIQNGFSEMLPIIIDSTRPWTEQIWRPEV